ncbi:MAG: glutathione ABC transporter substrate-binding protein [Fusobacteriaceae bacterium]
MKNIILFIMIGMLGIVGCSKEITKKNRAARQELVIAQEGEPKTLDVHNGNDGLSLRINKQIYSRLVESDGDMKIIPGLAKSWKNIDNRTMQFSLRENVKFHNGDDFTSEDVKFSFERMMSSPRISFILPPIEKIEIVDKYTVNLITKTPFAPLLAHLSHPALGIVSKKSILEDKADLTVTPIGTGPYKFLEWKPGDRVVLEKNENYFLGKPNFEKIIYRSIVEASSRTIGLETKELDVALGISTVDEATIRANKHLKILKKPSISYAYIGFNMNNEKFRDIRVRQAINYAIDKQSIIDAVLSGSGTLATSPIAPTVFGFTTKTKAYSFDLKKAKELMSEAGIKELKTYIYILGGEVPKQIAEIVQANLKEIGIDMQIRVSESSSYFDITGRGEHEMFLGSWGTVTGDADYGLYPMYHSSAKGSGGNRTFYSNKVVDNMLDLAKITVDLNKRKELYEKIQIDIVNDAPDVMLYNSVITVGVQDDIEGLNIHPVTLHDFNTIFIKN